MAGIFISDKQRFGRDTLLWRDSDEVWRSTKPASAIVWPMTQPVDPAGDWRLVRFVARPSRRTLIGRLADAWRAFLRN